jgi:hypothetical protein
MNEETKKQIEQLINQRKEWLIESLVKFCIELAEGDNWIDVKDELPKYNQRVLLYKTYHDVIEIGIRLKTDKSGEYYSCEYSHYVTHWQPLPKPPKTINK